MRRFAGWTIILAVGLLIAGSLAFGGGGISPQADPRNSLPVYQSPYYVIHSDLARDDVREAALRMTRMVWEYHARTSDFSGVINQKLPFYLFRNEQEYYAAGGPPKSAGVFTGDALLVIAGEHPDSNTWHTVQHEGFHQFAASVIGGNLPTWLNEGLAEYFGEGVFTGDSFVTGVVSPLRLRRVRAEFGGAGDEDGHTFMPAVKMMNMTHETWNSQLTYVTYDQAWTMVHFLLHGEDGRYNRMLSNFVHAVGRGQDWQQAWIQSFGGIDGFEAHWKTYWQNLPPDPTDQLYARATVATLTSFLARASEQKQTFADFAAFEKAGQDGSIRISDADWLPPALLKTALDNAGLRAKDGAQFSLEGPSNAHTQVVCVLPDGTKIVGHYLMQNGMVATVMADIAPPVKEATPSPKDATPRTKGTTPPAKGATTQKSDVVLD